MKDTIDQVRKQINDFVIDSSLSLEAFRIQFLGSKGVMKELYSLLKLVPNDEKRIIGLLLNDLRSEVEAKIELEKQNFLQLGVLDKSIDLTKSGEDAAIGSHHPLTLVKREIISIFSRIGFTISEGPEIEDDWHNFSALNFPEEHPARDMQDTFFIEKGEKEMALRTHTSSVQVRVMENSKPPIRTISPGRVYRNEAISARAHCFFHQLEGLFIDKNVSFADLKQTLLFFAREMFGEKAQIRLRPSYFPFT
jgi:phenylalanyl-tRNA synthetase alpha chain